MLSDVYSHFKIWDNYLFLDEDYSVPVQNCYQALCHNKEQAGTWTCSIDVDDIARVLLAYIQYFVTHPAREAANAGHPGSGVKYYYDEWSDRNDPYRKELVSKLAKMSEQHDSFVNDVLSYFYWAIKRGVVKSYILSPIGVSKFKEENWHRQGFWASTIDNIESVFQFMADTLKSIGHIAVTAVNTGTGMIGKAIDAVGETFSTAAGFVSNLPYIAAGYVVLVAGFQVYHYNKRGKFYGEDTAKKLFEKKAGLGDGGKKKYRLHRGWRDNARVSSTN